MPHFVAMKCISDMMNFEEKGDLCEHLSTQIPLFPRLSVTRFSFFTGNTIWVHDCIETNTCEIQHDHFC